VSAPDPTHYLWWLGSRSAGLVAFALAALSVMLGLAMAVRVPGIRRFPARALHEQLAIAMLAAIALHGALLLGDRWLRPGVAGILVPFAGPYRPLWTGVGVLGGYLALLMAGSVYAWRRTAPRRWRSLHRAAPVVYVLSLVHLLGAGSDAGTLWLRIAALATTWPIASLLVLRLADGAGRRPSAPPAPALAASPPPAGPPARLWAPD
jgi:methionine sulfoxide reductase heme-binding subunit